MIDFQNWLIFSFVCALPMLFFCRINEKTGYIWFLVTFIGLCGFYCFEKFYIDIFNLVKELFKLIFTKQNILKALKIILYIILALSLLLNLILLEERQELRKQIPHIAGIGGALMEKPDPIPNPKTEADYINNYCQGFIEYTLPDKTRVDCLYDGYAIEFDFAKKWAESIGQSLYYAKMTGNKPAVAIIMKSPEDERYIKRIEAVNKSITIFRIKAY